MLCASLALAAAPAGARAASGPDRIRYDSGTSVPLTLSTAAIWIGTEFPLKHELAPDSCRWCDRDDDGRERLNGLDASIRRHLRWSNPDPPRRVSDILLFAGVPATALGGIWLASKHDDRENEFGRNAIMMFESVAVSMTLNQAAKFLLARQRPYVHFQPSGASRLRDADDNLSFYSGHAAVTFSISTAAGTIASLRGYRRTTAVWIPGVLLAATTGYLRIACDRHYFTDVLTGVALGTAVGIGLPRVMHEREEEDGERGPSASVAPMAVVRWRW